MVIGNSTSYHVLPPCKSLREIEAVSVKDVETTIPELWCGILNYFK